MGQDLCKGFSLIYEIGFFVTFNCFCLICLFFFFKFRSNLSVCLYFLFEKFSYMTIEVWYFFASENAF